MCPIQRTKFLPHVPIFILSIRWGALLRTSNYFAQSLTNGRHPWCWSLLLIPAAASWGLTPFLLLSDMISTSLVLRGLCCFVHFNINPLHTHTNLNHTKRVTWSKIGFSELAGPHPVAGSPMPRLSPVLPSLDSLFWSQYASIEWKWCPVFDWLHPSLFEIFFCSFYTENGSPFPESLNSYLCCVSFTAAGS